MSGSPPPLDEARAAERRAALRRLVARPLLLAERDPDVFPAVVRHRAELSRWFAENAGWALAVDASAGHARLMKRPARPDPTRPAHAPGKGPFDRRRYTLLCLALAALEDGAPQVTLARLAEEVRALSLEPASAGSPPPGGAEGEAGEPEEEALAAFDPEVASERHAFVDVLRLLGELGVLVLRDGDADRYARSREGDALYDVRERLLAQLLSAPRPPALAGTPERMREEERAQTEEGERTRARQEVFRRLIDDPVVYLEDLDPRTREWLLHGSGFVYERLLRDAGLAVERRAEGLSAVDPAGTLTDTTFPEGNSTVKHAALLLSEWLADRARAARAGGAPASRAPAPVPTPAAPVHRLPEIAARLDALRAEHAGRWSKEYEPGEAGTARLAEDAMRLLVGFGLAARVDGGFVALPAAARFAPLPASA